ncbi:hypothetical protein [Paenibacillus sp. BC26]|uniref:hypothetical protein n=1 Tax=Paenibacillus sp. BC26 TaxID=1881032 RepID=UPI0008E8E8E3|nr:hypothetical protein [Paenibacillus sp. BC26]SFS77052.1 hypothetical protein SAMN05428962_2760 [Paenibacillus sp. BC26]
MRNVKILLPCSVFLFAVSIMLLIVTHRAEAIEAPAQEPHAAATAYFNAYISKSVEGMLSYSVDKNYLDNKSRKKAYQENAKSDTIISYKIVNSKSISSTQMDISVQLTYSDIGTIPAIPYSVIRYDDGWKVLVKPIEINMNKNSPQFGEIKDGTPMYQIKYTDN